MDTLLRVAPTIFVMPSRSEGLPMALLEAMAYGMAVVATRVGGIPEVVDDGVDGLLVPTEDPAAIATALRGLAADPSLRERLAAARAAAPPSSTRSRSAAASTSSTDSRSRRDSYEGLGLAGERRADARTERRLD